MFKITWKKYLIFAVILSAILALIIPEFIHYYTNYDSIPATSLSQQMDINIYGLVKLMLIEFSYWFTVSFVSLIILGLVFSFIRKSFSEQKQFKGV